MFPYGFSPYGGGFGAPMPMGVVQLGPGGQFLVPGMHPGMMMMMNGRPVIAAVAWHCKYCNCPLNHPPDTSGDHREGCPRAVARPGPSVHVSYVSPPPAPAPPPPPAPTRRLRLGDRAFAARSMSLLSSRGVADRLTGSRIRVADCTPEKRQALDILAGFKARSPFKGVAFDDVLSFESGQAIVFKGSFGSSPVAIKTFFSTTDYEAEVRVFQRLGTSHPNILPLLHHDRVSTHGICVLPLVAGGSLSKALNDMRLPEAVAKQYAVQIAGAVIHMHNLRLAHRDLKPDNILLSARNTPMVMDFGCSSIFTGDDEVTIAGTMQYCAPEVVSDMGRSDLSKTDVWSFGMLLYEMLSGLVPYVNLLDTADVDAWNRTTAEHIASGKTPELADRWASPKMKQVVTSCWAMDPKSRPTMQTVLSALSS